MAIVARVCISPTPQSPSPKLETTRSLDHEQNPMKVEMTGASNSKEEPR